MNHKKQSSQLGLVSQQPTRTGNCSCVCVYVCVFVILVIFMGYVQLFPYQYLTNKC